MIPELMPTFLASRKSQQDDDIDTSCKRLSMLKWNFDILIMLSMSRCNFSQIFNDSKEYLHVVIIIDNKNFD
jgi:hypothetical protein